MVIDLFVARKEGKKKGGTRNHDISKCASTCPSHRSIGKAHSDRNTVMAALRDLLFFAIVLSSAVMSMSLPTAKTRGETQKSRDYSLDDIGRSNEQKMDVITSNRHRRRRQTSDNLMAEARQYLSEEELEEFDLENGESAERLKEVVAEKQNKGANFSFGYSIQVVFYHLTLRLDYLIR